jgi:biopolymer transport protein ExbB/biopolymer transport protein TolQ
MIALLFDENIPWHGNQTIRVISYVFLGFMGILTVASIVERYLLFRSAVKSSLKFAPEVAQALKDNRWDEALTLARQRSKQSYLARVVCAGLETRERLLEKLPPELVIKHMEEAMERETLRVHYSYIQGLARFEWIGGVAPFVGVLGGSPYSFAVGTFLAVPALWFASYMRAKTIRFETEMKDAASEVTTFIEEQTHSK